MMMMMMMLEVVDVCDGYFFRLVLPRGGESRSKIEAARAVSWKDNQTTMNADDRVEMPLRRVRQFWDQDFFTYVTCLVLMAGVWYYYYEVWMYLHLWEIHQVSDVVCMYIRIFVYLYSAYIQWFLM
jgi:hypothetical protein